MSAGSFSAAGSPARPRMTFAALAGMKERGEPIAMVTAYDYPSALAVDKAGDVFVSNRLISLAELHTIVSNKYRANTNIPVYISGDKDATHGSVIRVLDAIRREGVEKVSFAISPQETQQQ